jgi:hypothetical protein
VGGLIGVVLATLSVLAFAAPSRAQAGDETTEPAKVEKEAYYTAPANGAVPATLTKELPPGIVCIVIPQVCGTTLAPVTGPLGSVVAPVTATPTPDYTGPQSVEPNTLPVSLLGGKSRYTSYLKFALPSIPSGSLLDRFDLVLTEAQVSYALESPAFRAAVLAGLEAYETKSPEAFVTYLGSVANQTNPLATTKITGIELCAVTAAFPAGPSQDASTQPARDCIFGANGVRDEASKTWTFDISLLAQAWLDGSTPNVGVYLGPLGADNLAFGDPDTSTNWQVSLGGQKSATPPQVRYAYSEGFGEDEPLEDLSSSVDLDSDLGGDGFVPSVDTFSGSSFDPSVSTGASLGGGRVPAATATPTATVPGRVRATLAGESRPTTPWWLWLLLPLGLGGSYAFGRSVDQEPPAARAGRGALTRLMSTPASGDGPATP